MKKSSFVALILGTISGVLFSLGMCMALLPEWNAFSQGIGFGVAGIAFAVVTTLVWFKMEKKSLPKINGKNFLRAVYGVVSALILGVGLCLCLALEKIVVGTLVGLLGIIMLIALIPMIKGIK